MLTIESTWPVFRELILSLYQFYMFEIFYKFYLNYLLKNAFFFPKKYDKFT